MHQSNQRLPIHGHAWTNADHVKSVQLSIDYGATWSPAELQSPVNRFAWQHFDYSLTFPTRGYFEVWARAIDSNGESSRRVIRLMKPNRSTLYLSKTRTAIGNWSECIARRATPVRFLRIFVCRAPHGKTLSSGCEKRKDYGI